jgi:SAM-dependent methyltransferase
MDLTSWLAEYAKGKILDIGSGANSYIPVDTAADISAKALAENREAKKKVKIRPLDKMTAKSWPFSPLSFDTIMLNSVLSYVKNRARLLRFLHSTLKPGGLLLITNAPIQPHHPAMFFVKQEVKAGGLARELKKAGFEVKDESAGQLTRLIALRA